MDEEMLDSILADMQNDTDNHMADGLKPKDEPLKADGHTVTITIEAGHKEPDGDEMPKDGEESTDGGYAEMMKKLGV